MYTFFGIAPSIAIDLHSDSKSAQVVLFHPIICCRVRDIIHPIRQNNTNQKRRIQIKPRLYPIKSTMSKATRAIDWERDTNTQMRYAAAAPKQKQTVNRKSTHPTRAYQTALFDKYPHKFMLKVLRTIHFVQFVGQLITLCCGACILSVEANVSKWILLPFPVVYDNLLQYNCVSFLGQETCMRR